MTLTQQWRYLNLTRTTRNSFYILFPVEGIMGYRQGKLFPGLSTSVYKELVHSLAEHF